MRACACAYMSVHVARSLEGNSLAAGTRRSAIRRKEERSRGAALRRVVCLK